MFAPAFVNEVHHGPPVQGINASLAVLVFLRNHDIASCFLEMKASLTGDDVIIVYKHFDPTWINGFGPALICQNGELFRTNNYVEDFCG